MYTRVHTLQSRCIHASMYTNAHVLSAASSGTSTLAVASCCTHTYTPTPTLTHSRTLHNTFVSTERLIVSSPSPALHLPSCCSSPYQLKTYVGGLSWNIDDQGLLDQFSPFGPCEAKVTIYIYMIYKSSSVHTHLCDNIKIIFIL